MKRNLMFAFFFIIASTSLIAQIQKNSNDVALVKVIDVTNFIGKKYIAEVDIKSNATDSLSKCGIANIQIGKHDNDLFWNTQKFNLSKKQISNWKTFSIEGVISPESKKIWIYFCASGNGDFYFDNIKFKIFEDSTTYKTVIIKNSDFEQIADVNDAIKMFENTKVLKNNLNIKASIASLDNNKSFCLSLKNNTTYFITQYGNNAKTGEYVTVKDGKKIYYETYGQGEPLILLHGNGGSISSFYKSIPELAKQYKVIVLDTRGQGKSVDTDTQEFNYDLFTDDLEYVINSLKLEKVNVVGWSDGAIIGLLLSIRHPELIDKLVLMGANLNPSNEALSKKAISIVQKIIRDINKTNDPNLQTTLRLSQMLLKQPNILVDDLHKVKAKTLVMAGENDLILEKHTQLIAKNIANSQLNIIKNETHFLPEENATLFVKIVLDFLKSN